MIPRHPTEDDDVGDDRPPRNHPSAGNTLGAIQRTPVITGSSGGGGGSSFTMRMDMRALSRTGRITCWACWTVSITILLASLKRVRRNIHTDVVASMMELDLEGRRIIEGAREEMGVVRAVLVVVDVETELEQVDAPAVAIILGVVTNGKIQNGRPRLKAHKEKGRDGKFEDEDNVEEGSRAAANESTSANPTPKPELGLPDMKSSRSFVPAPRCAGVCGQNTASSL
ncbi:hypothetical protein HK102_007052 [Quaeritorhiza haematococci]|nr:hypothetical protein HK102_007052 [Quaeritorhiza haematococci]